MIFILYVNDLVRSLYPKEYSIDDVRFEKLEPISNISKLNAINGMNYYRCSNDLTNKKTIKYAKYILKLKEDIEEKAKILLNSILGIICKSNCFTARKIINNNKDEIEAKVYNGASIKKYIIVIKSVSTCQINRSKVVYSNRPLLILEGDKVITIWINDKKYDLNVNLNFEDTNMQVFRKICKAINDKGIGVVAQVIEISSVISRLQIESKYPGLENKFNIEDKVGRLVCDYDLDNVAYEAQDLKCIINDKYYKLKDNNVILDNNKLKIRFKKLIEGYIILIIKQDTQKIVDNISECFQNYNRLIDILPFSRKVKLELNLIRKFVSRNKFNDIGIVLDKNFKIKFNKDIFIKKLQKDSKYVENLIKGKEGIVIVINKFVNYILNHLFDIIGIKTFKVYDLYTNSVIEYNIGELIEYFV